MTATELSAPVSWAVATDRVALEALCRVESARHGMTVAGPPVCHPMIPASVDGVQMYPEDVALGLLLAIWPVTPISEADQPKETTS